MIELTTPKLKSDFFAPDFNLLATDGKHYDLSKCKGDKGLLIMFICNHCPYVKSIISRLVADTKRLKKEFDIGVAAIMPNDTKSYPDDSYEKMKEFAKNHDFDFPYLLDEDQKVAKSYDAVCTPDFFGFNKDLKLCYRGRFDASGRNVIENNQKDRELFKAMVFISKNQKLVENQKPSIGCSIKWIQNLM